MPISALLSCIPGAFQTFNTFVHYISYFLRFKFFIFLSFTEFLEKFGLKEKIANLLEISEGEVSKDTFELYKELAEDYLDVFDLRREEERKLEEILKNKLEKELFEEVKKEIGDSIYHTNRTIDIIAVKDKDGIIEHVIRVVSPGDEEIRKERQVKIQGPEEGSESNSTNN